MNVFRKLLLFVFLGSATSLAGAGLVGAAPLAGLSQTAPSLQAVENQGTEKLVPEPAYYRRHYRPYRRYYPRRYYRRYYYRPYRYYRPRYYYPYYYRPYYYRGW